MSIKFVLKPCSDQFLTLSSPTTIPTDSFKSSPNKSSPKRIKPIDLNSEFTIDYDPTKSNTHHPSSSNSILVFDLKLFISSYVSIKPDTLSLYILLPFQFDKFAFLNDKDNYILTSEHNSQRRLQQSSFRSGDAKQNVLYYKIIKDKHKVVIDVFQNQIEKIIINLSLSCSIYMLKHLVNTQMQSAIPFNEISIYGVGYVNNENYIRKANTLTKAVSNKKFQDNSLLEEVICYYASDGLDLSNCILNLILIKKSKKKCIMGLDFRFNDLRNLTKLDFNQSAPSYRETSDGLNLFIYCMNSECELASQYYVVNKGYGQFNLMEEIRLMKCPKCHKMKKELRNIGFIKSKWKYKGILKHKKDSTVEGDGFTLDNKLYVISEVSFELQFLILLIETEPYLVIRSPILNANNENDVNNNNNDDNYENSSSELNDISLCLPDSNTKSKKLRDSEVDISPIIIKNKKTNYKDISVDINNKVCDIVVEGKNRVECNACYIFPKHRACNNEDKQQQQQQEATTCVII